jgi:heptosyltransferase-2
VVPQKVDEVLKYGFDTVNYLKEIKFDIAINLDKDKEACALLNQISADKKFGFILKNNVPYPVNRFAEEKFLTGIFDDISKRNKKNYLEEMFEICGFKYNNEKYLLYPFCEYENEWKFKGEKKIIGFNTGCGGRWTSRLWPEKYWIELAQMLLDKGFDVLFLGGEQEHEKNKRLSMDSGAKYLGYFKLEKFINLVDQCDLVVTAVTMAMHITLALGKKIVLMNNIFNPNEFELFGLGEIIQPEKECKCFFSPKCTNQEYNCMEYLKPESIFDSIIRQLK